MCYDELRGVMMRTIDIDEDVYQHLVANTQELEETGSSILRRLLGLKTPSENGSGANLESEELTDRSLELLSFVDGMPSYGNTTRKYMRLLGFLHAENPDVFERVLSIRGRIRRYFATSREEISSSGTSTHPQQIPKSDFWALTNADSYHKREILRQVLTELEYEQPAIQRAVAALR